MVWYGSKIGYVCTDRQTAVGIESLSGLKNTKPICFPLENKHNLPKSKLCNLNNLTLVHPTDSIFFCRWQGPFKFRSV